MFNWKRCIIFRFLLFLVAEIKILSEIMILLLF